MQSKDVVDAILAALNVLQVVALAYIAARWHYSGKSGDDGPSR